MGALTLTVQERGVAGDLRYAIVDAAFSSSYATGGDTGLTAAAMGWTTMVTGVITTQEDGFTFAYNISSGTVLAYQMGFADQGARGANNTIVINAGNTGLEISGTGTAFQAALSQVTNATDLSTTPGTVRVFLMGR
tara:strand:+ start:6840 stop:7247 length:408 start_codon:yes stop_codon:yes gene_type:complete